jgi:tetratricopeptide (TPR) repeat protein
VFAGAAAALAILYFSFPLMRERVMQFANDAGERSRPIVWRGAWDIFREHPVFGGGAGSFNVLFEAFRPEGFRNDPIYAHCDYLNTLCDYGLVGFVLLLGAAAIVAWHCAGSRGIFGAAFTGLLAFSLHLLVDFHLKLPALAMIFATVSAFVTAQAWPLEAREADSRNPSKAVGICVAAAALFLALAWAIPKYRADETSRAARDRIDKMALKGVDISKEADALAAIRDAFGRAVAMDPSNAQAWSDKAYADTLWALVDPTRTHALGVSAADEADRAIALSPIVAEFWIRKGSGLDMQQRWIEGGECTAKALQLAPTRADIWYYCAYHLSLNPAAAESATAAVNLCLRLDPSFLLAQALRQRLSVQ